jgi:hypothetical protein
VPSGDPIGEPQVVVKAVAVKVFGGADGSVTRTIKNGATAVTLSRSKDAAFGSGWKLAAAGEVRVTLEPGETLYAICNTGTETTLEVI